MMKNLLSITVILIVHMLTIPSAEAVSVGGAITANTTWFKANNPYVVVSPIDIQSGKTLAIQPGVVVKFMDNTYIQVNGTLNAQGNSGDKIYFTDVRDDVVGGDTNGDGDATTPVAGWWGAIRVENAGAAAIDFAEVRYGGGYWFQSAVYKTGSGSFSITNSKVSDSASQGIMIQSDTSSFDQGHDIYNQATPGGGTWNIDIPAGSTILSGTLQDAIFYNHGYIDVNGTRVLTQAYVDQCSNSVTPQTNITALLHTGSNAIYGYADGSDCGWNSYASAHITYQITHAAAYVVSNNVIENNASEGVRLEQISGPVTVSGNTVRNNSNGIGIQNTTGAISVTGNTVENNRNDGIYLNNTGTGVTITSNTITGNAYFGIYRDGGSLPTISSNTLSSNTLGAIGFGGHVSMDTTLTTANSPYVVNGGLVVDSGKTLTIQPGVVVKFHQNSYIQVYGTLNAQGSSVEKIYFTDVRDDSIGGDTNGDGGLTTPSAGWWAGVRVENAGAAAIDFAEVRYGGGYWYQSTVYKTGSGSFSITNSKVSDSATQGIMIQSDTSSFDQGHDIYNQATPGGGTWNIDIPAGSTILSGTLQDARFYNHGYIDVNGIRVLDQTYVDQCDNYVSPQANITAILHTGSNAIYGYADGSDCGWNSYASAHITYQITHAAAYVVSNNVIENNGSDGIYLEQISGPVTVSGNTVRNNSNNGIYLNNTGTWVTITGNTISNNAQNGVSVNGSSPTVTDNTITGNGYFGIYRDGGSLPTISGNTLSSNTLGAIGFGGHVSMDTTLTTANSPYVVNGGLVVDSGKTLTIQPGVVVKFHQNSYIQVYGTLNAQGSSVEKIYFTDVRDDSIGGDTNGDGGLTTPSAGWWAGIRVENAGAAAIDFAEVRYGGGYWGQSSVYKTGGGSFSITNSKVSDSATQGIMIQSDTFSFDQWQDIYNQATPGGGTWNIEIPAGSTILSGTLQDATFYNHGYIDVNGTRVLDQAYVDQCSNSVTPQTNITALLHTGSNAIYGYADGSDCGWNSYASAHITYQITHAAAYVVSNNVIENNASEGVRLEQISGPVTVSGNTVRNNSNGIGIQSTTGAISVTSNTVENNRNDGIYLNNTGTGVTITGNTISNNAQNGVSINGSSPTVTSNTITGNGYFGIYRDGGSLPTISDNTLSSNTLGAIGFGGNVSMDTTLTTANSPYVVNGGLVVDSGKTLTIQPGVVVKFQQNSYIQVYGTLNAQGTSEQKIYFTDIRDDSIGDDTNGDGGLTTPSAGWWGGVRVEDGGAAAIDYAEVRYAGAYYWWWGWQSAISKTGSGSFSITNSKVSDSATRGVAIQSDTSSFDQWQDIYNQATPGGGTWNIEIPAGSTILSGTLQDAIFYNHGYIDVNGTRVLTQAYVDQCSNSVTPQTNITALLHTGSNAIYGYADGSDCGWGISYARAHITYQITHAAAYVVSNNVIENNGSDGIYLEQISGPMTVSGNTVRNNSNGIGIQNTTGAISITSNTVENNRNDGIYLNNTGTGVTITGNTIRHNINGISLNTASPTIIKNIIYANVNGIYCTNSSNPLIGGSPDNANDIYGNTQYAIYNEDSSVTINGQYNFWGSPSGPPAMGPNSIFGNVDILNYLTVSIFDTTPPTGTVVINDGGPYTNTTTVTLNLASSDGSGTGTGKMCISETTTCPSGNWESYITQKTWTFATETNETKNIYVWFRDYANNTEISPHHASIILDTVAPDITLTSAPAYSTESTSASFGFNTADPAATLLCRMDKTLFSSCASPKEYTGVTDTSYFLNFDGTDDYVAIPDSMINSSITVTFEAWFKTASGGVILGYQDAAYPATPASHVPALYVGTDGKLYGTLWPLAQVVSGISVNDGSWHHAALVGNVNTVSLYLDGNLLGSSSGAAIDYLNMNINQIGMGYGGGWNWTNWSWYPFNGSLDEVRIWNMARSQGEIQANLASSLTGTESGLVAYWKFDEGKGTSAANSVSGGNTATLVNGTSWSDLHRFEVEAVDPAQNATPAVYEWPTSPDTAIDTHPANPTKSLSASFDFSSSKRVVTYECKLDNGALEACTSPKSYASLAEGNHTFTVKSTDAMGVADPTPASYTWRVDITPPTVTGATSTTANGHYRAGNTVNVTVNFSEPVTSSGLTISLNSGTSLTTGALSSATSYSGTYTVGAGQTSADLSITSIAGTITDATVNATVNPTVPAGQNIADAKAIVIDTTPPAVAISAPSAILTKGGPVTYTVTYTDTNFNASTLASGNITLNRPGTANGTLAVSGTGTTRTVTISSITGDGTLGISIAAGTATDVAGNSATAAGPSGTFTVDNTVPTITGATSTTANGHYRAGNTVNVTVTFSETVTSSGLTINLNSGASLTTGALSSATSFSGTYTVGAGQTSADLSITSITGTITDAAANATVNPTVPAGQNIADAKAIVIDTTPPAVAISAPSATATKGGPVTYTVTYTDTNFNASTLTVGNITLNKTGTANGTLAVSGTGTTRTVTISSITGDGAIGISIAAGTATDLAGNSTAAAGPSGTFTVDNTVPTITGATSTTANGHYRAGNTVNVTVTFSEPVSSSGLTINLNSGASLTTGALSSATSFSGTYTVGAGQTSADLSITSIAGTITDAAANGTVNPTVPAGQNIADAKAIVIDTTPPAVAISAPSAILTKGGPVTYTVTYTDTNFNASTLASGNITLNKTGTANGTLAVSGTGTTRTVTISSITGDGAIGISIAAGTATDLAGNSTAAAGPSGTFAVDNTVPTITGATSTTANGHYRAGNAINVTVTFSEPVTSSGLTINLNSGASLTTGALSSTTSFSGTYTVGAGQTSADLSITSITGTITDAAANATVNPTVPAGQNIADAKAIVVDTTPPAVAISAPSATATKGGPVAYTVTYTDTNFNASTLTVGNITLNKTGTANGTLAVSGTGTIRTVTISSITGDGTLGISIAAGTATDLAGNSTAAAGPSGTFAVDNTVPTITGATSTTANGHYRAGNTVNVTVTFSETVTSSGLTINLNSGASLTTGALSSATSFSGTYTVGAGQTSADLSITSITGTITDAAANATVNPTVPAGQNIADAKAIVIDTTPPAVAISAPSAILTKGGPVTYTVTYTDTNFNASTLASGNITLNRPGTANGTLAVSGTGTTRTVTISSITGDGTLGISIAAGTATDVAGNSAAAAGPSGTFTVDNTVPTITGATSTTANGYYRAGNTINITVNFSEPVTSSGLTINLNSGASLTTGALSSATSFSGTYTVGAGQTSADLSITSITGTITDAAANATVNPTVPAGQNIADAKAIVVDTTPPAVAISAPSATATKGGPVAYTVTYTDTNFNASTLTVGNITLNKTGTANGTLAVSGTGTIRTVTISSITGDGTIGVSLAAATASDLAGNTAAATGASLTFNVDNTLPDITVFSVPATATSLTVTGINISAADNFAVTGYCLSESSDPSSCLSWPTAPPTQYVFTSFGEKTLYAFARDAAGNVRTSAAAQIIITQTRTLTVSVTGTGGGSVTSVPAGISCTYGNCTDSFPENSDVALYQVPDIDSTFGGWTVDCTGNGECAVNMATDKNVTASFILAPLLMIYPSTPYNSLQEAYTSAASGSIIMARVSTTALSGGLNMNKPISIVLRGGYSASYATQSGYTNLEGTLTIGAGSLVVDRLTIK